MHRSERFLRKLHFGNDAERFSLRLDFEKWEPVSLELRFHPPDGVLVQAGPLERNAIGAIQIPSAGAAGRNGTQLAAGDLIELSIPLAELGLTPGEQVSFQLRIVRDGIERERHPETGAIQFQLLDQEVPLENWIV
jgi:hypothetical protein